MTRRVIALILLIAVGVVPTADACLDAACCLDIYREQLRHCYRSYLSSIGPTCLNAVIICGCALAPILGEACVSACLTALFGCIASILAANVVYEGCVDLARFARDICLDDVVAECI